MQRYLVHRTFPDGLDLPAGADGAAVCDALVAGNSADDVTWIHSYVTDDRRATFCVYDAPSPEAIRRAAARSELPVDRITEVRVLDPYHYVGS